VKEINANMRYMPLSGVEISVFRGFPVLQRPAFSDANGFFEFKIPSGQPFWVQFAGEGRVVELQQISGQPDTVNTVHITLLTIEQLEAMKGISELKKRVRSGSIR
jgi:hypothetical protein